MSQDPKSSPVVKLHKSADAPSTHVSRDVAREVEPEGPPPPVITGLAPTSAAVGDPSFNLRVLGSGFDAQSVIVFAGQDEPTTFLGVDQVTTGMNMAVWHGADQLSVLVRNADGQTSNTVFFDLQPPRAVPLDPAAPSKPSPAMDQI